MLDGSTAHVSPTGVHICHPLPPIMRDRVVPYVWQGTGKLVASADQVNPLFCLLIVAPTVSDRHPDCATVTRLEVRVQRRFGHELERVRNRVEGIHTVHFGIVTGQIGAVAELNESARGREPRLRNYIIGAPLFPLLFRWSLVRFNV
jgi:hypothetical protein